MVNLGRIVIVVNYPSLSSAPSLYLFSFRTRRKPTPSFSSTLALNTKHTQRTCRWPCRLLEIGKTSGRGGYGRLLYFSSIVDGREEVERWGKGNRFFLTSPSFLPRLHFQYSNSIFSPSPFTFSFTTCSLPADSFSIFRC